MLPPTVEAVPSHNPRPKKVWTYEQAKSHKAKAEEFTRFVREDDDRADEIAEMSVEDYAAERGVELEGDTMAITKKNGTRPPKEAAAAATEVKENPAVAALQTATRALDKQNELQQQVRDQQRELDEMNEQFDSIVGILEDDDREFSAEDRLEEISKVLDGGDEEGED